MGVEGGGRRGWRWVGGCGGRAGRRQTRMVRERVAVEKQIGFCGGRAGVEDGGKRGWWSKENPENEGPRPWPLLKAGTTELHWNLS